MNPAEIEIGGEYAWLPPKELRLIEPVRAVIVPDDRKDDPEIRPLDSPPSILIRLRPKQRWNMTGLGWSAARQDSSVLCADLFHPDLGQLPAFVADHCLAGAWHAEARMVRGPFAFLPRKTWAMVAAERYEFVKNQRAIAQRLTGLGIPRANLHYAGFGGTAKEARQVDARLELAHGEWEKLLDLADRGNT